LNVEKCLQFQKDEVLWEVKQQSLAALPKVGHHQLFIFSKNEKKKQLFFRMLRINW
jgi:hypothetical protein